MDTLDLHSSTASRPGGREAMDLLDLHSSPALRPVKVFYSRKKHRTKRRRTHPGQPAELVNCPRNIFSTINLGPGDLIAFTA